MAKFDEEEKSGETRVVCFVLFFCLRSSSWPNLMKRKKVVKHGLFVLFCFFLFLFCLFSFFSCQKVPIDFSNFHNFFDRDHYRDLKNSFFSFSQHCGFCLFVCFCVVTQNFETGDESRSAEQKSFFSFSSGHHKINRWAWLGNLYGCPTHFFSLSSM